jgi:glutathione S-transferase
MRRRRPCRRVHQPASMAELESQAGWGSHEAMLNAMESAIADRAYLLGDGFSMADVIFGGTLRFMLALQMLEARPSFTAYAERLGQREALTRAEARNAAQRVALGLA